MNNSARKLKTNAKLRGISIQKKFMIIVSAIIIFSAFSTNFLITKNMYNAQFGGIIDTFNAEIQGISTSIDYLIRNEFSILDKYIYNPTVAEFSKRDLSKIKNRDVDTMKIQENLNSTFENNVKDKSVEIEYLLNDQGIIVAASDRSALLQDVSNTEYFQNIKNGKDVYISNIMKSNETGKYVNVLSKAIYDEKGELIGVICRDLVADAYVELLEKYRKGRYDVFVTDAKGNVIYHYDRELIGKNTGVQELDKKSNIKENQLNFIDYNFNGEEKFALGAVIPNLNWYVYSNGYMKDITKGIRKTILHSIIILITIIIIVLYITHFVGKKFTSPLKKLQEYMQIVAEGNLGAIMDDISTGDEIEELSKEINSTTAKVANVVENVQSSVQTVSGHSEKLLAVSEEVTASNSEIVKAMNEISCKTCSVAEDGQECMNETINLEEAINNLKNSNNTMVSQSDQVVSSINESSKKINLLVYSKVETIDSFNELKNTMQELFGGINNISGFLEVIRNISKQINLLSLNAAIEAARAGDAGKGFAVVSNEIKALSTETDDATDSIANIIEKINLLVDKTKETLNDTEDMTNDEKIAFIEMEEAFENMRGTLNKMVKVTMDISSNIDSVNDKKSKSLSAVSNVVNATQQIAAITEEVTASASEQQKAFNNVNSSVEDLESMAQKLQDEVSVFIV